MTTEMRTCAKGAITPIPSFTPLRSGLLQRKCACGGTPGPTGECEECRKKKLQRETRKSEVGNRNNMSVPPIVHEVLHSSGQPLDWNTRAFMEPRFGHDFSHVRVHTDAKAADSARALHAHAYTIGHNIVFAANEFAPATHRGRELLAHELVHVRQQANGRVILGQHLQIDPSESAEMEAERVASTAMLDKPAQGLPLHQSRALQRQQRKLPPVPEEAPTAVEEIEGPGLLGQLAAPIAFLTVLLWPSPIAPEAPIPEAPKRRRRRCLGSWVPPAGGDAVHDEYARQVAERYGNPTFATVNFLMEEDGLAADFDHYNPVANEFFEAKTRHEILLREWDRNQPAVVARLRDQAERQFAVITRCAMSVVSPKLIWFFDDPEVALEAQYYLGDVVDEVRHAPWETEPQPSRRRRKSKR